MEWRQSVSWVFKTLREEEVRKRFEQRRLGRGHASISHIDAHVLKPVLQVLGTGAAAVPEGVIVARSAARTASVGPVVVSIVVVGEIVVVIVARRRLCRGRFCHRRLRVFGVLGRLFLFLGLLVVA